MKKLILSCLLAASTMFGAGFGQSSIEKDVTLENPFNGKEQRYIIGTATDTSSYYKAGSKLAGNLKGAFAATTDGSGQNLDLLAEGKINVAFVQGDVYNHWMNSHPGFADKFTVIVTDRTEHVQLIMREGMTEDDLQKKGAKVFVGLQKSGGAGSWRNMQLLEPNYIAEPVYGELDQLAINDLVNRKYDGIIRTSHIDAANEFTMKVNATKGLYFADVDDSDLNDKIKLNGEDKAIYNFTTQQYKKAFIGGSVKLIETRAYIVIHNELTSRKQRSEIADVYRDFKTTLFQ
jgi:TRAP-type uncharacterized transport system substrate-binding protein